MHVGIHKVLNEISMRTHQPNGQYWLAIHLDMVKYRHYSNDQIILLSKRRNFGKSLSVRNKDENEDCRITRKFQTRRNPFSEEPGEPQKLKQYQIEFLVHHGKLPIRPWCISHLPKKIIAFTWKPTEGFHRYAIDGGV